MTTVQCSQLKTGKMALQVLLTGLLFVASLPALAADGRQVVAESRIYDVTVFNDRALVKRTAEVKLAKGENVVSFAGLPMQLLENTIRAEGKGGAAARISGLSVRNVFLESSSEQRVRELETAIETLEAALRQVEAKRLALVSQRAFIDSIRVGWGERISKELSTGKPLSAELAEANRFVGDAVLKIEESNFAVLAEQKPLNDRISALKKQLAALGSERRREMRTVEVTLEVPKPMTVQLELSYLVMQARWEPFYDIRLAADAKSVELAYRASVSQSTGEDWQGVKLSLSTATPSAGSSPPELQPWRVSFLEPPRPMPYGDARKMLKAAAPAPMARAVMAEALESGAEELQPLENMQSQAEQKTSSTLFLVPKSMDVPSDGSRQNSLIALEKIPAAAEYAAVPKLLPKVFLKSEVTNTTSYPLLAGMANVFNDNVFIGRMQLKSVASGEKFALFFGSDDSVKVKRTAMRLHKEAGLLSSNQVSWDCRVELDNYKGEEIKLSLFDQMPIAANQEIRAQLVDPVPKPDESTPEGKVLWKLLLKAGEKREVTYRIDLEYPKGRAIVGAE